MNIPHCAIVTTLKNAEQLLWSFINYHLAIGFDKIYLFFDDKDDPSIGIAEQYAKVKVIRNDEKLIEKWKSTALFSSMADFLNKEVMSRQVLNAELAIEMALEDDIRWLLHIDIDELFYTEGEDVKAHFHEMDKNNYNQVTYRNHEAVPETFDINNSFQEVSLFKKNRTLLSAEQYELLRTLPVFNQGKDYFWFYGNGKSAVKVVPGVLPDGVHYFKPKFDHLDLKLSDPVILHYAICGFDQFWNKYVDLGFFDSKWFDADDIPFRMHLNARDIVNKGSISEARLFYANEIKTFMELLPMLMKEGIVQRIHKPSKLLNSLVAKVD